MGSTDREGQLEHFLRGGRRDYAETCELLQAFHFHRRATSGGHEIWTYRDPTNQFKRGVTLTITTQKQLKVFYRQLVVRKIREVVELERQDDD